MGRNEETKQALDEERRGKKSDEEGKGVQLMWRKEAKNENEFPFAAKPRARRACARQSKADWCCND